MQKRTAQKLAFWGEKSKRIVGQETVSDDQ
jgi:hypothetical protein